MTSKAGRTDEREAFLLSNLSDKAGLPLSAAAVADLRYFRDKLDKEGRRLSWNGLKKWMEDQHGLVRFGRQGLHRAAKQAGIEPWWTF